MLPRERVLAALSGGKPDRTPRDFWAEEPTWARLLAHAGHDDRERLLCDLGIDVRHINAVTPPDRWVDGAMQNLWGERFIFHDTQWGRLRSHVAGALADAASLTDLERFPWPSVDDLDFSGLVEECRHLDDYAFLYGFADIWQRPSLVRGMEGMFLDMAERPEWAHFLCRRFTGFFSAEYTRAAEVTNGRIDMYLVISDLGTQRGPLISHAMFAEFVAPYIAEMVSVIHSLGGRALFHSCGNIATLIPTLLDLGIDVLDPIQPVGPEMAPERLAAEFGGRACFHGGIDMQHLLPLGTPDEVRAEARRYCEVLGAAGGYILSPAHLFQPDVPPGNVTAMYDSAP